MHADQSADLSSGDDSTASSNTNVSWERSLGARWKNAWARASASAASPEESTDGAVVSVGAAITRGLPPGGGAPQRLRVRPFLPPSAWVGGYTDAARRRGRARRSAA